MAQTPISATVQYNSTTPATLYTVPAGKTAVVKSVLSQSVLGNYNNVTINKVSGGVTYPLVVDAVTGYNTATGTYFNTPGVKTLNLLQGPITLGAGDSITVSTSTAANYKFPASVTPTTNPDQRISNVTYLSSGHYVAVGNDRSTGYGLILTSTDGITWTKQNFPFYTTIYDIAYDGSSTYVVVGLGGSIYYSTNLTSWTENAISANTLNCVTYGNSKWVAGGENGQVVHATTASGTWTSVYPTGSNINSIATIGSNWAFGTTGLYFYSSNLTSFTYPHNGQYASTALQSIGVGGYALGSTVLAFSNTRNLNSYPTDTVFSSTNYGKSFTSIDLSSLSGRPQYALYLSAMNNGGWIGWMRSHGTANSAYIASANGTTWTSQNYTGSFGSDNTSWYTFNLYGQSNSSGNSLISWLANNKLQIGSVSSSGIYANQLSFTSSGNYLNPNAVGWMNTAGAANSTYWIAVSRNLNDSGYQNAWYGSGPTSGGDTTYVDYYWYTAPLGTPSCATHRPGRAGYIFGVGQYIYASEAETDSPVQVYVFTDQGVSGQSIAGIAAGTSTSSTSRIIAITSTGYTAWSVNQGVTWNTGGKIPTSSSFNIASYRMGTGSLVTNGNYWIAMDNQFNFWYTTDGITWVGAPFAIEGIYNLNSLNIMMMQNGLAYTTGTNVDDFTFKAVTTSFASYPSVKRMSYVNGTYLIGRDSSLHTSTDLSTWTTTSLNSTQINNESFITTGYGGATATVTYSNSGSPYPVLVGSAVRAPTQDNCYLSKPTPFATTLNVGYSTAGIVEIS